MSRHWNKRNLIQIHFKKFNRIKQVEQKLTVRINKNICTYLLRNNAQHNNPDFSFRNNRKNHKTSKLTQ